MRDCLLKKMMRPAAEAKVLVEDRRPQSEAVVVDNYSQGCLTLQHCQFT
jgi:hypothetical protein